MRPTHGRAHRTDATANVLTVVQQQDFPPWQGRTASQFRMSFGEIGRYHRLVIAECSLYLGKLRFLRKGITEHAEKVRLHPKKTNIDSHRVNTQINTVTALIVRKAVLRKGNGLYAGAVAQPVRKPSKSSISSSAVSSGL